MFKLAEHVRRVSAGILNVKVSGFGHVLVSTPRCCLAVDLVASAIAFGSEMVAMPKMHHCGQAELW